MALASPGTRDLRLPALFLLLLLLPPPWAPALALLAGELGHKPWGTGGGVGHGLSPKADTPGPGTVPEGAGPKVGWGTGLSCGVQRGVLPWATGACVPASVFWDLGAAVRQGAL